MIILLLKLDSHTGLNGLHQREMADHICSSKLLFPKLLCWTRFINWWETIQEKPCDALLGESLAGVGGHQEHLPPPHSICIKD